MDNWPCLIIHHEASLMAHLLEYTVEAWSAGQVAPCSQADVIGVYSV